jgi:hypothetical protein
LTDHAQFGASRFCVIRAINLAEASFSLQGNNSPLVTVSRPWPWGEIEMEREMRLA